MAIKNRLILIVALLAGLAFIFVMVNLKQPPERINHRGAATPVSVLLIAPQVIRTEICGYGQVQPTQTWQAVASVRGRVSWKHPNLESGELISEGVRLLQIEPARYELAQAGAEADRAGVMGELRQLEQEEQNTNALLALENRRLALAQRELDRIKTLTERGALTETRLDEQHRSTLQQEQAVQTLENQLRLFPAKRNILTARLARSEAALESARMDIDDTRFEAPWDMRVHQSDIGAGQQVNPGQTLFVADNVNAAEATVQLEMSALRNVLSQLPDTSGALRGGVADEPFINFDQRLSLPSLTVWVYPTGMPDSRWPGKLTRITSGLDPATRTVQAVITVAEPYRNANPPTRPPLVRNTFVQATISAPTSEPVIAVPASAVHQGMVYLADNDDRLQRRPVTVAWQEGDLAIVSDGLKPGDRLILDDLNPAIEGTPLSLKSSDHSTAGDQS